MTVEYLDLTDYLAIAAEVTGLETATVTRVHPALACRLRTSRPASGRFVSLMIWHGDAISQSPVTGRQ